MKIWLKSIILLWVGISLLSCVITKRSEAPSSPTRPPTWTPTASPQATLTPTVQPSSTPSPTSTPTVLPASTPTLTPTAQIAPTYVGPFRKVTPLDPTLLAWHINMQALPDGGLRVMTNIGYATYRDGRWDTQLVDEEHILVGVDAETRAWILGETGDVISYRPVGGELIPAAVGWTPIAHPLELQGRGVVSDDQGRVWLATEQDVRVFDGEQWTTFTRKAMGMSPPTDEDLLTTYTLIYVESRQQMWVGSCDWGGPGPFGGGGARWFDGQAWRGAQSSVADGCVTAIKADAEGRVWIGLHQGRVYLFDQTSGKWREFLLPEPQDYRRGYPVALSLDREGAPWLLSALCGGASCDTMRALYHFQDNAWREVLGLQDYHEDLYQGTTLPVLFDETGAPWFFFGGMAFRIQDDRLGQPVVVELNVWDAATDAAGHIWVVANSRNDLPALWVLESEE
ncbi:MAG TPA: hypothetical protein PLJ78_15275 [Anaerolineae bacterium]|nr:hypothetical protein [Anaerolineae bacterium]HQK15294.1 hypothetical protein [Anaerolineae bacterium]